MMKRIGVVSLCFLTASAMAATAKVSCTAQDARLVMQTSKGEIVLQLNPDKAPVTVKNFCHYVKKKLYDNTIFHRVIPNFMIQGGGFNPKMQKVKTFYPIANEAPNGLKNNRGTIAMARTFVINSATNQFFINLKDNAFLNHRGPGADFGYAVFGKVVQGMKVVDAIAKVQTAIKNGRANVPVKLVIIQSITVQAAKSLHTKSK